MSVSLEIEGTIHMIGKELQVTDKFKKRDFVLHVENESNPQYDDHIQLQMTQDKCAKLDEVQVGFKVKAFVNVRGKEYTKKDGSGMGYFNTLEAWKFDVIEKGGYSSGLTQKETPATIPSEEGSDLPF